MYDLIVRGGRVVDPSQGVDGPLEVGISRGLVRGLAPKLREEALEVVDARGKVVVPGLIDLHTHVYQHVTRLGLHPDTPGIEAGVTTVVDTGSSGAAVFEGLRRFVLPSARSRVFCLLHICPTGQCIMPEIRDWRDVDWDGTVAVARAHRDLIKGIKVRAVEPAVFNMGSELVKIAKRIAQEAGLPLMVHVGYREGYESKSLASEVVGLLERGDVITHFLTPKMGGVIRYPEQVPLLKAAVERGVVLDVAGGATNLSFQLARRAMSQGIFPSTLSTDLTVNSISNREVRLTAVMSAFQALGLDLAQIVAMTTINAARVLGEEEHLGSLKVGMPADLSILEPMEGDWPFSDCEGETIRGRMRLEPRLVIREGKVYQVAGGG